jgi:hypothetical protein
MPYGKPGKLSKRLRKYVKTRRAKHHQAVKTAKTIAKKAEKAQLVIAKSSPKMTAGELLGSGDWKWEGSGMSPDTVVEPVWGENGWEYVPARVQPKKAAPRRDPRVTVVHSTGAPLGEVTTLGKIRRDSSIELNMDGDYPDDTKVYLVGGRVHLFEDDGTLRSSAKQCRGRTKDGTPCRNVGSCPIASHKRNKV